MKTWNEPLDQQGNATYAVDYSKEMTKLDETLASVNVVLSTEAIDAGLVKILENIVDNVFSLKFSIPNVNDQIFTRKGKTLEMKITYVTSGGETDTEIFALIVREK